MGLYKFEQLIEKVATTRSFMGEKSKEPQEFIKDESHTIYGEGYRMIKKIFQKDDP